MRNLQKGTGGESGIRYEHITQLIEISGVAGILLQSQRLIPFPCLAQFSESSPETYRITLYGMHGMQIDCTLDGNEPNALRRPGCIPLAYRPITLRSQSRLPPSPSGNGMQWIFLVSLSQPVARP